MSIQLPVSDHMPQDAVLIRFPSPTKKSLYDRKKEIYEKQTVSFNTSEGEFKMKITSKSRTSKNQK